VEAFSVAQVVCIIAALVITPTLGNELHGYVKRAEGLQCAGMCAVLDVLQVCLLHRCVSAASVTRMFVDL